jgi:uncharacterized protein YwgA
MASSLREEAEAVAQIVADAGGRIVGRTKLQKICYMLEVMEFGAGFDFDYRHYGPYSEELSSAIRYAELFDLIDEETRTADWGGSYSIFKSQVVSELDADAPRRRTVVLGNNSDPIELELAATAVLLARDGFSDPWKETKSRKPDKAAEGRLGRAKALLQQFRTLDVNSKLPEHI